MAARLRVRDHGLREFPDHRFEVDGEGVDDFFCFGHTLPPRTIFKQVRPLEPGHLLQHRTERRSATSGASGNRASRFAPAYREADWIEETRARVLDSVGKHMLSDVPVGAFLSGGVDSSAVAAAMARSSSAPIQGVHRRLPRLAARRNRSRGAHRAAPRHRACRAADAAADAADVLPAVQAAFDEPTAATSAVPLWYLSRTAAEHVKVVLCGEGGDEVFLGYNRQRWAQRMARWKPLIEAVGEGAWSAPCPNFRGASGITAASSRASSSRARASATATSASSPRCPSPRLRFASGYTPRLLRRGTRPRDGSRQRARDTFPPADRPPLSDSSEFMLGDLTVHLPASMCQRLDRSSMAHSLEARVPFLSHRFGRMGADHPCRPQAQGRNRQICASPRDRAVAAGGRARASARSASSCPSPTGSWAASTTSHARRGARRAPPSSVSSTLKALSELFDEHRSGTADHGRHPLCDRDVQLLVGPAAIRLAGCGAGNRCRAMTPKVSVILPVHNRADVLPRAIHSVLDQELREFELIVVDDGSTDGSADATGSFGDERIKLIRLGRNRGGNVARNAGVRAASAPLIAFIDSDDRYLPNKLAWVAAEFDRRPSSTSSSTASSRSSRRARESPKWSANNPVIKDRKLFRTALFTRQLWKATPAISVRREIALEAGLFDETLRRLQDFDF